MFVQYVPALLSTDMNVSALRVNTTMQRAVVACHHGLNTDMNKIQIEVKHIHTVRSYKGPVCDVEAPKTNLLQNISSTGQNVSDLRLWVDTSLYLNQLLMKCLYLMCNTLICITQSTDDVTRVLPHLKASKFSSLC